MSADERWCEGVPLISFWDECRTAYQPPEQTQPELTAHQVPL